MLGHRFVNTLTRVVASSAPVHLKRDDVEFLLGVQWLHPDVPTVLFQHADPFLHPFRVC